MKDLIYRRNYTPNAGGVPISMGSIKPQPAPHDGTAVTRLPFGAKKDGRGECVRDEKEIGVFPKRKYGSGSMPVPGSMPSRIIEMLFSEARPMTAHEIGERLGITSHQVLVNRRTLEKKTVIRPGKPGRQPDHRKTWLWHRAHDQKAKTQFADMLARALQESQS
jgi:predicted transcriptional regulator